MKRKQKQASQTFLYLCIMSGVYIHIPFCKQKCTYCDFHFSTRFHSYRQRMIDALCREIELRKAAFPREIETIYFGGGTPSLLTEEELIQLFSALRSVTTWNSSVECTLEANPDDMSRSAIQSWKRQGINRLSVGIQSFDEEDLIWMNRVHNVEQSKTCLRIAQEEGIGNLSLDLIYGLPNMDVVRWKKQIDEALASGVQHISAYCLTVEEKTALHKWVEENKIKPAGNELQSEHFDTLLSSLNQAGFEQYEISNFALSNYEAKHNSSYWKGNAYVGIGPSAHSFDGNNHRSWNISNNHSYMTNIESNTPWFEVEELSDKDRFNEKLLTGLRTKWGVSLTELASILPLSKNFHQQVETFQRKQWIDINDNTILLTPSGKLMADYIASELFII